MKKFTGFIAAAAIAMTPMSSSALEALTDNAMNDVTGQAGVSIAVDDIVLFQSIDYTKYTDEDGISESPTYLYGPAGAPGDASYETDDDAASLVISAKETLKVINGIWTGKEQASNAKAGELMADGWKDTAYFGTTGYLNKDLNLDGVFDVFVPSSIKIDVGTCTTLSRAAQTKLGIVVGVRDSNDADLTHMLTPSAAGWYLDADNSGAMDGAEALVALADLDAAYLVNGTTANTSALSTVRSTSFEVPGYLGVPVTTSDAATVTGVVIGLPTVEITTTADSYSIGVVEVADNNENLNSGKNFIKIEKGNSMMALLGGTLEIAPH